MISQKTKYALKALVALADGAEAGRPALTIEEIAQRSGTPKRFLEHILLELRNGGYLTSRRGRSGGYALLKRPDAISIGQVLRLVDGPMAPLPCLSRTAYQRCADCQDEDSCRIRRTFGRVYEAQLQMMETLTLADMLLGGVDLPEAAADLAS